MFWAFYVLGWAGNTAFTYLITTHHTWLWFPQSPGLASGICMGGYGIGSLVWAEIMTPLLNPDNVSFTNPCYAGADFGCYNAAVNDNFRRTLYILISIFAGFAVIGMITIYQGPVPNKNQVVKRINYSNREEFRSSQELEQLPEVDSPKSEIWDMMKTKQFALLYLMNTCSVFIGLFIAAEWKVYWQTATNAPTDHFMATAGSFGSVFNGMRFVWSWLLDYYSYKSVYGALLVIEIIVGVTMPFLLTHKWLYTVWICLGYWCLGGHFTLLPN